MKLEDFSNETLMTIIRNMPLSILITDTGGNTLYSNKYTTKLTKYTQEELLGKNPRIFQSGKTPKSVYKNLWNTLIKGDVWTGDILNRDKEGNEFWERSKILPIQENGVNKYYLAVKEDITEHIEELENTRHMAHYDNLTGLMNRPFFETMVEKHIRSYQRNKKQFSLLMIDLNNFKLVNDTYGHDRGDEVLRNISICLQNVLRENDICCRLGGDEFVILLDDTNMETNEKVTQISNRINDELKLIDCGVVEMSASIGIAVYPDNGSTYLELLKSSDIAMYQEKRHLKNKSY